MTKTLRKFVKDHLDSPGVTVETGQSVAAVTAKSFGRASDVAGVVPSKTAATPAGERPLAAAR